MAGCTSGLAHSAGAGASRPKLPNGADFCHGWDRNASQGARAPRPRTHPSLSLRETSMRKIITLAIAFGVGLVLAGCGGSGSDTINFGIGAPITGSNAAFGTHIKQG